jgi:tape measure domain-containing protein
MADAKARIVLTAEDQTRQAFGSVQANLRQMQQSVAQIRNIGAAVLGNEIVQSLGAGAKAILQARIEVEKLNNVLGQAVGVGRVGQELDFIRGAASRLGLEFQSTASSYAKFAAASRGTALEGQQTRDIFTGIAQASAALGLSSEETAGALTAVQQIISKGKVSAEELRGQLGERLPGAFQIAARSIGVTTQELDKLLSTGSLLADDFLPKFGRQLSVEFADAAARAAVSTQASFNKLETAWGDLKRTLSSGPVGDAAATGLTNLGKNLENLATFFRDADRASQGFFDRLANFAPPVGLTGIILNAGARQRAQDGERDAGELARLQRRANELPPQVPRGTASQIRGVDNAALAGITSGANDDLKKLLQGLRTPEQQQRDQIAELRRLGGLTGQDVSGGISEIQRRAAGPQDKSAETYLKSLREQLSGLKEITELEKVRAEIADGRLSKATAEQQLQATITAAKLDDAKRLADAAEADLRRIARFEEADAEQGANNEREAKRLQDIADGYRDLVDPARQYRAEIEKIQALIKDGGLDPDVGEKTVSIYRKRIDDLAGLGRETKVVDDATKDLGLTFEVAFEKAVVDGENLRSLIGALGKDLARLALREGVTKPIFSGLLGLLGGGRTNLPLAGDLEGFNALPFADGGVMTSRGRMPLRRYAGGGIARSAQLAMFGEGSLPEAYVPLPDGRSIPVTVSGGGGVTVNQTISMGSGGSRAEALKLGAMVKADTLRAVYDARERAAA